MTHQRKEALRAARELAEEVARSTRSPVVRQAANMKALRLGGTLSLRFG